MPAGRPSEYDPAFCEQVIAIGEQGGSLVEMAYGVGVSTVTLTNWSEKYPEFLEAFTRAKMASQVWWEQKGRDNLNAAGFQGSMWSRSMAARFPADWREKQLVGSDPDHPLPAGVSVTFKA